MFVLTLKCNLVFERRSSFLCAVAVFTVRGSFRDALFPETMDETPFVNRFCLCMYTHASWFICINTADVSHIFSTHTHMRTHTSLGISVCWKMKRKWHIMQQNKSMWMLSCVCELVHWLLQVTFVCVWERHIQEEIKKSIKLKEYFYSVFLMYIQLRFAPSLGGQCHNFFLSINKDLFWEKIWFLCLIIIITCIFLV